MTTSDAEKYRERRAIWLECLGAEDINSIVQQIHRMVWNAAAFRVIIEARRLAPTNQTGEIELSGLVHNLIDCGFADSQMLAIRRLTDGYPIADNKNSVFSLMALLNDMKCNLHLMTRKNVFLAEGLTYDVETVCRRGIEFVSKSGGTAFAPANVAPFWPEWRHKKIDFLAGVQPKSRSPSDTVRPVIIDRLQAKIRGASNNIETYVNKFVAHASSPESRRREDAEEILVTLDDLWRAHEVICKVATFVGVELLNGSLRYALPFPQFDHLAHIQKPLVGENDVSKLDEVWNKYQRETNEWTRWGIDEFQAEMKDEAQ